MAVVPKNAFVCLITQGHGTDLPILKVLLRQKHRYPYIGMIGSDTKAFKVRKALKNDGFTEEQIAELHSPIGLSIGTNHPTEIAISIIANCFKYETRYSPKALKSVSRRFILRRTKGLLGQRFSIRCVVLTGVLSSLYVKIKHEENRDIH